MVSPASPARSFSRRYAAGEPSQRRLLLLFPSRVKLSGCSRPNERSLLAERSAEPLRESAVCCGTGRARRCLVLGRNPRGSGASSSGNGKRRAEVGAEASCRGPFLGQKPAVSVTPSRSALSPGVLRRWAEKRRGAEQKPQRRGANERRQAGGSPEPPSIPSPSPPGCSEHGRGCAATSERGEGGRKRAAEARSKQALLFAVATLTSTERSHAARGRRAAACPCVGAPLQRRRRSSCLRNTLKTKEIFLVEHQPCGF